jgi:hypothetical protein
MSSASDGQFQSLGLKANRCVAIVVGRGASAYATPRCGPRSPTRSRSASPRSRAR